MRLAYFSPGRACFGWGGAVTLCVYDSSVLTIFQRGAAQEKWRVRGREGLLEGGAVTETGSHQSGEEGGGRVSHRGSYVFHTPVPRFLSTVYCPRYLKD